MSVFNTDEYRLARGKKKKVDVSVNLPTFGVVKKVKTSVSLSKETLVLADSIAESEERSRSWVIDRAILAGLTTLDTPKSRAIRAKKKAKA